MALQFDNLLNLAKIKEIISMTKSHHYEARLTWTGNTGTGTSSYRDYSREFKVSIPGKPDFNGSADSAFRGDPNRHNPEELLVMALSSCHMLWYLHLCADQGLVVLSYSDHAEGVMTEASNGSGAFREVVLRPAIVLEKGHDLKRAMALHQEAHDMCFIANSVHFPVTCEAVVRHQD